MLKFFLVSLTVIVLLLGTFFLYGKYSFNRQVDGEVRTMFDTVAEASSAVVSETEAVQLPEPVYRWLTYSGVVGKPRSVTVRLKQEGLFRQAPEQSWLPFTAEQYFVTPLPGFVWYAGIRAGLFNIAARDRLFGKEGNMLIRLLSLFTVADVYGEEIDRGTMLRFLGEIVWFPSAALSEYLLWEQVDENSAQATLSYGGISVSARFFVDEAGRVEKIVSERHREVDGRFVVERWSALLGQYGEFGGVKVPIEAKAVWNLESGDFVYFDATVTEAEYNRYEPY